MVSSSKCSLKYGRLSSDKEIALISAYSDGYCLFASDFDVLVMRSAFLVFPITWVEFASLKVAEKRSLASTTLKQHSWI